MLIYYKCINNNLCRRKIHFEMNLTKLKNTRQNTVN